MKKLSGAGRWWLFGFAVVAGTALVAGGQENTGSLLRVTPFFGMAEPLATPELRPDGSAEPALSTQGKANDAQAPVQVDLVIKGSEDVGSAALYGKRRQPEAEAPDPRG